MDGLKVLQLHGYLDKLVKLPKNLGMQDVSIFRAMDDEGNAYNEAWNVYPAWVNPNDSSDMKMYITEKAFKEQRELELKEKGKNYFTEKDDRQFYIFNIKDINAIIIH